MPSNDFILWCDIETTGNRHLQDNDPFTDHIIEIGLILTDQRLNSIASNTWLISEGLSDIVLSEVSPIVLQMHATNGLWEDLTKVKNTYDIVQADIIRWLNEHTNNEKQHIPFAGSGIGHFDRKYIATWLPELNSRLTYWPLDVGVIRRMTALAFPESAHAILSNRHLDAKTHRALDDAFAALDEAREWVATQRRGFGAQPAILWNNTPTESEEG